MSPSKTPVPAKKAGKPEPVIPAKAGKAKATSSLKTKAGTAKAVAATSKKATSQKPPPPRKAPPPPQPVKSPVTAKKTEKKEAPLKTTLDDLVLDIDEKDQLREEEKKDLAKALREDEDEPLETAFVPTDTSERYILVVDEEGQRRTETMTIVSQILPNAIVEVADDPEEALEIMQEADFDTYVVNFLMPGYSASPFVKAVANHPDHPLLIGFAADKISDALDQKKGLKIIPLKRLFDLDVSADSKDKAEKDE